jgi:hypothetical protein
MPCFLLNVVLSPECRALSPECGATYCQCWCFAATTVPNLSTSMTSSKGGFPLGEIFRPNRNFSLFHELSSRTNCKKTKRNFVSVEKFRLVESGLNIASRIRKLGNSMQTKYTSLSMILSWLMQEMVGSSSRACVLYFRPTNQ